MNWDAIDWAALGRLRKDFLSGSAGQRDYWQSESDLASYDATFAQRIGWKWDCVLRELTWRGWKPPMGELLDWGCGSGIAGRAFSALGDAGVNVVAIAQGSSEYNITVILRGRDMKKGVRAIHDRLNVGRAAIRRGRRPALRLVGARGR